MMIRTEWYLEKLALAESECLIWIENDVKEMADLFKVQSSHYREILEILD